MQDGLQSDAKSLDVLMSLADLYVKNGLVGEAKGLLKTAIEQNKNAVEPYSRLCKIYLKEGNKDKALKVLRDALIIEPENETLNNLLNSIEEEKEEKEYKKEKKEKSEEIIEKEIKAKKEMPLDQLIKAEIEKLLKIEGIMGVIMVDEVGSLIFAELNLPLDDESTGAIINTIYNRINETMEDLNLEKLNEVIIELPGGNIIIFGTINIRFITLVKRDIHISTIEENIKEIFDKTRAILGVD
jgi:predicted regulator of Ras-like GTPase activity (Roadblock/LC7/MglB family)